MSERSLKIKIEDAFQSYLKDHVKSVRVLRGHDHVDTREDGRTQTDLIVHARDASPFEDMPPETGCLTVSLACELHQPVELAESLKEEQQSQLEEAMLPIHVQASLNQQPPTENDTRTVVGLHIYDIDLESASDDRDGDFILEVFEYNVTCGQHDAPGWAPFVLTALDPLDLSPFLYFKADTGVDEDGGQVFDWVKAGGSLTPNLGQLTADYKPIHDTSDNHITFDAYDDRLAFDSAVEQAGILIVATSNGIFAYEVDADSIDEITALGHEKGYFQGIDLYAYALLPVTVTDQEIERVLIHLEENGATKNPTGSLFEYWRMRQDLVALKFDGLDLSGVTSLHSAFYGARSLTSFPYLNLSGVTDLTYTFRDCVSLSSINADLDVSSVTTFFQTFEGATGLTSFPALDLSSGTTFYYCWYGCTAMTSFAALDLSSGTNFYNAWYNCTGLASFPAANLSSGTNFGQAWRNTTAMTTFGDCTFSSDPSDDIDFTDAWRLSGITDFPALDLSRGTNFLRCWEDNDALETFGDVTFSTTATDDINFQEAFTRWNNVASFPALNLSRGTNFTYAWRGNKMTSFGACTFSTTVTDDLNFTEAWKDANQMTTFPSVNLERGTTFEAAWNNCSGLTSFLATGLDSGVNFKNAWNGCSSLSSFPALDLSAGTNFFAAWYNCSDLASFLATDLSSALDCYAAFYGCTSLTSLPSGLAISSVTDFGYTWFGCTSLTSFPAISLESGTSFTNCWRGCSSMTSFNATDITAGTNFAAAWQSTGLTSFPALDMSSGETFSSAWYDSALTSFPSLNATKGQTFAYAWGACTALTTFPSGFFDYWSPTSVDGSCFNEAWGGCTSLTAASVENILNSIATAGVAAPSSGVDITIDYDATTGTPSVATAVGILKGLSPAWTITLNGTPQ